MVSRELCQTNVVLESLPKSQDSSKYILTLQHSGCDTKLGRGRRTFGMLHVMCDRMWGQAPCATPQLTRCRPCAHRRPHPQRNKTRLQASNGSTADMGHADAGPSRPSQHSEPPKSEWSDSNADSDFEREPGYRADEDEEDVHSDVDSGVYEDADDGMPTPSSKVKGKRRAYTANGTTSSPISPTQSFSRSSPQPQSQSARSWTDLNMSIIVALISPIGNWLTGSDHVKHLCLLLLLIYYLHQLIEGAPIVMSILLAPTTAY